MGRDLQYLNCYFVKKTPETTLHLKLGHLSWLSNVNILLQNKNHPKHGFSALFLISMNFSRLLITLIFISDMIPPTFWSDYALNLIKVNQHF